MTRIGYVLMCACMIVLESCARVAWWTEQEGM